MAIQIPNPGTGNGASGDNEFILWSKVKDNFSDQTNAASKLIGSQEGRISLSENLLNTALNNAVLARTSELPSSSIDALNNTINLDELKAGFYYLGSAIPHKRINTPTGFSDTQATVLYSLPSANSSSTTQIAYRFTGGSSSDIYIRTIRNGSVGSWGKIYTDANTTKDANGFIKAASPIVKVHADKVVLNDEAEQQNVSYKKNGIGDYTITTVSGLSTDGWYIELPKDMNGNPKVAVTLQETNGVISLKSYKRIFSMETFTFVPDLNEPLDIPDGRWIDLRLNEIPVEMPNVTQAEEVGLDK